MERKNEPDGPNESTGAKPAQTRPLAYRERLGNPDFISADEFADVILFCWKQPQRICIRDIVVMPTTSSFA